MEHVSMRGRAHAVAGNAKIRWLVYAALALILAILCLVPRPYVARAKLLPQDLNNAGLGQVLSQLGGQLGTFASLLGAGKAPNDLYLIIGRSDSVLSDVIHKLDLVGPDKEYASLDQAKVAVEKKVDVRLLLGGVVEVQARTHDPAESQRLTSAFVEAISKSISGIGRVTTQRKRDVVEERYRGTRQRLLEAESRLDAFRRNNRISADAGQQLGSELALRTQLQARLQAALVEQQTLLAALGPDNIQLKTVQQQINALRAQIGQSGNPASPGLAGPNVGGLSQLQTQYLNLYQEVELQRALYEAYSRAMEQTAVETLVTESSTFIQIVEPTHLDPDRKYNMSAIGGLVTLILIVVFVEWYMPATGLRFGRARRDQIESDQHAILME